MSTTKTHHRTCNLCEAMCGLEISYQDDTVLSIKGDPHDAFSRGHICPKAVALQDFYQDPDRLKRPLLRKGEDWEEISWDEAFKVIKERMPAIQEQYGKDALATYLGNPNAHNLGNILFFPYFFRSLGTKNRYSSASADQLPHHVAANYMLGHGMLIPIPDIDRTDYMLIIGGNPMVSNGSMMTSPDFGKRMRAIRERGGKVVVIDPRRTETARKADEHLFIRPESDALLLLAMIYTLFEEDLIQLGHLAAAIDGLDALRPALSRFSPEQVSKATGIAAEKIKSLAREMAQAPSAVCYSRMGASTQSFGGLCQWLTNVFNILTGNFDREGGAMFTLPAFDYVKITSKKGKKNSYGRYSSRVRGLPFYNGEFPVAALSEEILTPGEGQIKALICIAGNPVLSSPNGPQLEKALKSLDFMVSIDIYLNETSRLADLILPAATGLESSHYDIFFNVFAIRNAAKYSPPLFPRKEDQRYDWEILKTLTSIFSGQAENGITPEAILDASLKSGPYGEQGMSLQKLIEAPHGIDLGPLQPCLLERLETEDDRIQLAPSLFLEDLTRLHDTFLAGTDKKDAFPFALISRRLFRSHNTWMHNAYRLVKGPNECTLLINPTDAQNLNLEHGQMVRVDSATGSVAIQVAISDEIMEGVVSIPQGWGHGKKGARMQIAEKHPGVSINDLTDENRIDQLTGNAAFNGVPVAVSSMADV